MVKKENSRYEIRYLASFSDELNSIVNYITNELCNEEAAEKLLNDVIEAIETRSLYPDIFEKYEKNTNLRKEWFRIYVGNYIIFYTVSKRIMWVTHIIYSGRDYEELL